ncbi:transglutaminase-like cysteine peptidase [Bradyrhizobium lablabi]|uniref:transglutaminase-like cysteine peptidase n=1 Tax=Bradyrhizobium lablabi TaxID=722472 RepID=UPI001BA4EEEB|nr:transglutaminase-like cysteine peptidase [Bradyrhizobium lablabi]MBR1125863.1 transglutaminase-like cysteine peptidase [Bradyrhizobium lablabi]
MGLFGKLHALRAIVLACGLIWLGPASSLRAEVPDTPAAAETAHQPFGLPASPLPGGRLLQKWLAVQTRLDDELVQLALCDGDRDGCVSPAALKLLAIVDAARAREGRARIGEINRAINLAIKSTSDLAQYGEIDVWTSPLVTFTRGAGDCEDYAIAKFVALRLAGIAPDDLRIVIVHDPMRGEDHAIAAAKLDGRWLTLDNRRMAMVEDADARNYRPLFVIDRDGAKRYDAVPLLAGLPRPAPPAVLSIAAAPGPVSQAY